MCLTFVFRAAKEEETRRNNYATILSVIFYTDSDSFWMKKMEISIRRNHRASDK